MFQRPSFRLLDEDDARVVMSPKRTVTEPPIQEAEKPTWRQRIRPWLPLLAYSGTAITTLIILTYLSFFAATVDGKTPAMMGCRYFGYWTGPTCGLHGIDCQPFESDWKPIRCPTRCLWDGSSALEVIGTGVYKGDSRICRAAIHAGVMGTNGGCAMMKYSGSRDSFEGSTAFGVTSKAFDSWFPKTFEFQPAPSVSYCTDLSWGILGVGAVACFGLVFLPVPPVVLVHTLCIWGFLYVAVITSPDGYDYKAILVRLSTQVFVAVAAVHCWFHWVIKHTFLNFATSSKWGQATLWGLCYVVPFHVLLHLSFFAYIPWLNIDLGGYKYNQVTNTAAYVVLIGGGVLLLAVAAFLMIHLHRQKRLVRMLLGYVALTLYCAIVYAFFPSTIFHLHHVMVGLTMLPLTRVPKWPAYLVQAAGLGLFIQGYAAWGWPTFLDILPQQYRIDIGEVAPEAVNVTSSSANVTWEPLDKVYGYALMLNGVQVARTKQLWATVDNLRPNQTYFVEVSGIGSGGTDGWPGPEGNFTTAPSRSN